MKKIAFIIPYFGKFNNYFQLFLNSCEYNSECDWIIFTDDYTSYKYPSNVIVNYMTFDELKKIFQDKFDFEICLNRPYKLCDFKVSYGYVFSEYLTEYKFWGHCDTDLIWGNISNFISNNDLEQFDKIGFLGHCTIYKNTEYNNKMFMNSINGIERYKEVFSIDSNCSFDEEFNNSINNIFNSYNLKISSKQVEANIYTKSSNFKITRMNMNTKTYTVEKKKKSFFVWDKGCLYRMVFCKNKLFKEEYMYIHMQSRNMKNRLNKNINKINTYKIIPNSFDYLEYNYNDINNFNKIRRKYFNLHYFTLRSKNLYKKISKKLNLRKKLYGIY